MFFCAHFLYNIYCGGTQKMKDQNYFKKFIATIPDFPKKGIMFRDITPTLENPDSFKECIDGLAEIASQYDFNKIICAEARGFMIGSALAYKLHKGFVPARKPGKLPRPGISYSYSLEYGENMMLISEDALNENDRVLVLDDLLATGGSAIALIELTKSAKATPVAALFYVELPDLNGAEKIKKAMDIPVHSLVQFLGE